MCGGVITWVVYVAFLKEWAQNPVSVTPKRSGAEIMVVCSDGAGAEKRRIVILQFFG